MIASRDRMVGCIVGGAIGDVLGGVTEHSRLSLSDDTQLTLATCEAVEQTGRVSPEACAAAYLRWYRAGALRGMGSSTVKALRDLSVGAHWALSGARGEMAAGNGAAMRIAPLAFVLEPGDPKHRITIRDVCRITHHSDEAYIGALAVLFAIHLPVWPPVSQSFFSDLASHLPDSRVRDRLRLFAKEALDTPLPVLIKQFGSSGYVVETVPLALFVACRLTPDALETALGELANVGDDADTIGSIAGQVAGSHMGFARLPMSLVKLPAVQAVIPAAEAFAGKLSGTT